MICHVKALQLELLRSIIVSHKGSHSGWPDDKRETEASVFAASKGKGNLSLKRSGGRLSCLSVALVLPSVNYNNLYACKESVLNKGCCHGNEVVDSIFHSVTRRSVRR